MGTIEPLAEDYSSGELRKHHRLYLEDGSFVIQVEKAIFKIHRSVFSRYSSVIHDMLNVPNGNESKDGTEDRPLILTGDRAAAWETLFSLQYDSPLIHSERLSGGKLLLILSIAHKYCMDSIAQDVIKELKKTFTYNGFVDLVVASRIIDSKELYQDGLQRLIASGALPDTEQAERMGAEATRAVMAAAIDTMKNAQAAEINIVKTEMKTQIAAVKAEMVAAVAAATKSATPADVDNTKCRFCPSSTNWRCSGCSRRQSSGDARSTWVDFTIKANYGQN
ncbi:hypothetical protein CPB86DRAFT_769623 [Serendipita vermifera]|nr:hypothetical protein CPB86DRAFT_769623 [Serendipita vermifera]